MLATSVANGDIARLVALDQDRESLEQVARVFVGRNVDPCHASVRDLLAKRDPLVEQRFHFIYSAGLYDYLPDGAAGRLTRALCERLHAGGRLVIANFLPDKLEGGYMDSVMEWPLLYRSAERMSALSDIPGFHQRIFCDDPGNVVYLELTRPR
jgi:SAM-dependent methyltransferase